MLGLSFAWLRSAGVMWVAAPAHPENIQCLLLPGVLPCWKGGFAPKDKEGQGNGAGVAPHGFSALHTAQLESSREKKMSFHTPTCADSSQESGRVHFLPRTAAAVQPWPWSPFTRPPHAAGWRNHHKPALIALTGTCHKEDDGWPPWGMSQGHSGTGFVSTGALKCGCSQPPHSQALTCPWLGHCSQGPMNSAAVGLLSLPGPWHRWEGKAHGFCCLAGNQVSAMWCFSSLLCLSCSSTPNTLFFATPLPPLNYGVAKDLSHGMAVGRALSRAGRLLWVWARGSVPLPWHCLSSSRRGEHSAGKVLHEVPWAEAPVSPVMNCPLCVCRRHLSLLLRGTLQGARCCTGAIPVCQCGRQG